MTSNIVSMRDDPLNRVYQAAETLTQEDLEAGGEQARILNTSIEESLDQGIVPLLGVFIYLVGGNDPARIYRGLSRRLDDYENRGFPPLAIVAADYFRQLDVDPAGHEGTPLVSLCGTIDQIVEKVPSIDLRALHEALHLSFIAVCSMPDHQGIESDSDLVGKVASSALMGNLKGYRRAVSQLSRNNALVMDGLSRIRDLEEAYDRDALRDAYNALIDEDNEMPGDSLPFTERSEILSRALLIDVLEMQKSQYLCGDSYLVSNPVTVCGEFLTPASTMEFLRDFMDSAEMSGDGPEADHLANGGFPGPSLG